MASAEAAAQQRIIKHMNDDHQDSIVRYLEHYQKVSSLAAGSAQLTSITVDGMVVRAGSSNYTLPFKPPLGSLREARERLVAMDKEATTALARSDITVKEYRIPRGLHAFIFTLCASTYIFLSTSANMHPGSLIYDNVLKYVPWFARFSAAVRVPVLILMIAIHVAESTYMATSRLKKHTVPLGSPLWWIWICSTFIEGYGAFQRFDKIVVEKRAAKAKLQH